MYVYSTHIYNDTLYIILLYTYVIHKFPMSYFRLAIPWDSSPVAWAMPGLRGTKSPLGPPWTEADGAPLRCQ